MKYEPPLIPVSPFYLRQIKSLKGWKKRLLRILPLHVLLQVKAELSAILHHQRNGKSRKTWKGKQNLKINIGCGSRGVTGWVNVDFMPMPNVNCVCDCRSNLPFDSGSADCIFTEHYFEHLDYTAEIPVFLQEARRLLKPGGVLRIIVPDAGRYLHAYCSQGWQEISDLRHLQDNHYDPYTYSTYRTKMELVNEVFRQAYTHKFAYDLETLEHVLRDAGFSRIVPQTFGSSLNPDLLLDTPSRAHESLYIEAVN